MAELKSHLEERRLAVDAALHIELPPEDARPASLHQAMRYSLFAGGKRLRPILCLEAAEACGGTAAAALKPAAAVECIHTYSLIHDDLPCMDDDDLRRGQPTCHVKFGEGMAVLAGDALLTLAFEIIASTRLAPTCRYGIGDLVRDLAVTAGSRHLVGGQVLDLEGEGRETLLAPEELIYVHHNKTAALLTCSLRLGAMTANAEPWQLECLSDFGSSLGLAFQIIDDILDETQSSEKLGKSAGKDAAANKSTYPAVHGLEKSRQAADQQTQAALEALEPFGESAARLRQIAGHLLNREY